MNRLYGIYSCVLVMGVLAGCTYLSDPEDSLMTHAVSEVPEEFRDSDRYMAGFSIGVSKNVFNSLSTIEGFSFASSAEPKVYASTGYDLSELQLNGLDKGSDKATDLNWISTADNPLTLQSSNSLLKGGNSTIHPWDQAHAIVDAIYATMPAPLQNDAAGEPIVIVEPEFVYTNLALSKYNKSVDRSEYEVSATNPATVKKHPSPVWPGGEPLWYQSDEYSQLQSAREKTYKHAGEHGNQLQVRIAHLDTGYNASDKYRPSGFEYEQAIDFTAKNVECNLKNQYSNPKLDAASHGQRTLSVLAGNEVEFEGGGRGFLGGDPQAIITEYRIAKGSVVHLIPKEMTHAINCAIDNKFDIISMSAGGLPSIAQRNAVDRAYQNGVAIFAATGDFFHIPILNKNILGTAIGFPARYNRVMAVAGATAVAKSYGIDPSSIWHLPFIEGGFRQNLADWSLRGSYGPAYAMKNHAITAYAPNVTNSLSLSQLDSSIGLNGAGTSNTTPQAAAAASLWLKYHGHQFSDDEWRSWRKTEAVYTAMMESADKEKFNNKSYFGEGGLKALNMLGIDYEHKLKGKIRKRPGATIGFRWIIDTLHTTNVSFTGTRAYIYLDMLTTELQQASLGDSKSFILYDAYMECAAEIRSPDDCKKDFSKLAKILVERKKNKISSILRSALIEFI
jgi:hypothetical protein